MKDSVALRYAGGEAFVAEGGVRGTTMELAKIYNTLSFFYQEQVCITSVYVYLNEIAVCT